MYGQYFIILGNEFIDSFIKFEINTKQENLRPM